MAAISEAIERVRVLHALRSRDFRLLWGGQTISLMGNSAFLVALGWRVTTLTGSSAALPIVLMVEAFAMLATLLIGGALADRYERRALMIVSDLSRAAVVGSLAAVDATGHLTFALLIVFALGVGLGDGFFHPAFGGIVPLVVEQPVLPSANALIGISRQISFLIGPAVAAGLYKGAGSVTVFAFDGASFLFSAALLWLARPRTVERAEPQGAFREISEGARYVGSIPWLWVTIGVASLVLMFSYAPYQSLLPRLVERHFGLGVGAFGLLLSLQGGGMAIGTFVFGHVNPRRRRASTAYLLFIAADVLTAALALSPWFDLAAVLAIGRGVALGFAMAIWETMLMELVPEDKLSRVISVDFFGSFGLLPLGLALTAGVSGLLPPAPIIAAGAIISGFLWLIGLARRDVRAVG